MMCKVRVEDNYSGGMCVGIDLNRGNIKCREERKVQRRNVKRKDGKKEGLRRNELDGSGH